MHIVDTTLFFAPHSGGVKRYLLAKRRYCAATRGIRHTLVVPGPRRAASERDVVSIAAPRIPCGGGYRLPLRPRAWRDALVALAPDLIEAGDPYHLAWSALAAADRLGVPAVAFAHSHLAQMAALRLGRAAGRVADAYVRRLYARFDAVLAPSRCVAAHLRAIGVERVALQPLGVDAAVFHPGARDPALRRRLALPDDTRLLVFAGRMAREKSVERLCAAVAGLGAPYHLLLVGARERRRDCERVTELPYQQDATRVARLLASADALLHAGEQETFGLVALEAMACGRPVVGVAAGAIGELVDDSVGRLAQPGSVASLQQAIASLYEDDIARLGAQARARVEGAYAWERVFAAQFALYAQLTHGAAPAPLQLADPAAP